MNKVFFGYFGLTISRSHNPHRKSFFKQLAFFTRRDEVSGCYIHGKDLPLKYICRYIFTRNGGSESVASLAYWLQRRDGKATV